MKKVALMMFTLSLTLASCGQSPTTPSETGDKKLTIQAKKADSKDQKTPVDDDLIKKIDGFGGFYIDRFTKEYYVALKKGSKSETDISVRGLIRDIIIDTYQLDKRAVGAKGETSSLQAQSRDKIKINFKPVKNSLKELRDFKNLFTKLAKRYNINGVSIDVPENKIVVYSDSGTVSNEFVSELERLGVPSGVYLIRKSSGFEFTGGPNDYYRPTGAGVGIIKDGTQCSMGALGLRYDNSYYSFSTYGFFTAAHCFGNTTSGGINQGGYYIGSILTTVTPDSEGYLAADARFVSSYQGDLRASSFAQYNYGGTRYPSFNSWGTYYGIVDPIIYAYAYSYGVRGQIGGQIVVGPVDVDASPFGVRNEWCFEVTESEYDILPGQSGGLVLDASNSVMGIVSGRKIFYDDQYNPVYTSCFSSMWDSVFALQSVDSYNYYIY